MTLWIGFEHHEAEALRLIVAEYARNASLVERTLLSGVSSALSGPFELTPIEQPTTDFSTPCVCLDIQPQSTTAGEPKEAESEEPR